jgi:Mn2+/Fe2+ NRAMP family transporter
MPLTAKAILVVTATVGTTLAPWGLSFIQSYAVDKKLTVEDLRYERLDVVIGSILTGVIGFFVVVTCAATLHVSGVHINPLPMPPEPLSRLPDRTRAPSLP